MKRIGKYTVETDNAYIDSFAAVAGKKEGEGPLGKWFDRIFDDEYLGQNSFEKAESMLQKNAVELAIKKSNKGHGDIDYIFAGDLLNQCMGSSFGIRDVGIPYLGVYGACSTMVLSAGMASIFVGSGAAKNACAVTSSHFCSSERQFRFPLEYGSQRTPTAQWTVTASGALILTSEKTDLKISKFTVGKITDAGIKDANNMGAAMAPAAYETLKAVFDDSNTTPSDYDRIFTGDLGYIGSDLLYELFKRDGVELSGVHDDCGKLIFSRKSQDVHGGGSGCGCVGSLLCSYILSKLKRNDYKRILVCATGALLSTVSPLQGESIPSIAHCIEIEKV